MFVTYVTGIALWLVYGLMIHDMPLIASNAVTLVLSGTICYSNCGTGEGRSGGSGMMNSLSSPGMVPKRIARQSALACSIRSCVLATKFHQT